MLKGYKILLIACLLFLLNVRVKAQQFVNGDFETNSAIPCDYNLSNAVFNATMAGVNAYGGGGELDIMGPFGACPYGSAESGNWFIGLAYPSSSDAFTMDLCAPLIAGTSYTMTFWDKGDSQYPPSMPVVIGVSSVSGTQGTIVYTGPVPTIDIWTQRTFTFVAPVTGMYISVETAGPTRWTHVDNFSLATSANTITAGPIVGSPFCACSAFNLPFTSTGVYTAGNTYTALLSDATGSFATSSTTIGTLASNANAGTISCSIPCNAAASTLYQIQIVSSFPVNSAICGVNNSVNITVNAAPIVTVNSPTICPGQTATLTAAGATTYTWSAGVTNVGADTANAAPVVTTLYTVTGTAGGCSDTAVATVNIGGALNLVVNSPTICTGQTANLVATGATTYTWTAGVTVTGLGTGDATPVTTTTYTVTGTSGGCTGTAIATVTVVPSLTVTVTSDSICTTGTAHLVANGANTYTWTAGANSTGVNTADASPLVTTTYTVTGTSGLCSSTAVATVTVVNVINVTVNSATICAGQTAALTAGGAATYTWTAGATSTGVNTATASPATTTTYTVTGTSGTCTNTAVATVTVNTVPNVLVNSPTICVGDTAFLSANGATSYNWTAGASTTGINTAIAMPITTTTYTVTGTTNNCSNTAISTVTVNPHPVITVNSDTICQGQTTTLTATGATTYSWSSGYIGNPYTVTVNVTTFYTVTGTTNGCSTQALSTVYVNPPAVVSVNVDTICPGQTATLTAAGALTYLWNTGSTANPLVVSPAVTTTYTVIGNPTGCPGTATSTVQVTNIIPVITANSPTICDGNSATLTATGGTNYLWSTGATTATITVSPTTTTTYTVSTTNNCNNTASTSPVVTVSPKPIALFSTVDTIDCFPLCVPFTEASSVATGTITNWAWNFGDNTTDNTQNPPLHCYSSFGNYTVTLNVTASDGCLDTLVRTDYIHVNPLPIAGFTFNPSETNLDNANIYFADHSQGASTYQWNFGDSTFSSLTDPTHTYTHPGTYTITQIVTTAQGCIDTILHYILINDNFAFYAPNCITPNDDGINDVFLPTGTGWDMGTYQLWIFDRWGNMCFSTPDPLKGWDGRANGGSETTLTDVYVWKVELKDTGGESHKFIGSVTILK